MTSLHVVLPGDVDDPAAPSGGNVYDRRICDGLVAAGWGVRERPVPGAWPSPSAAGHASLDGELSSVPDGAVVLVDGLVAAGAADVLVPLASRARVVVLLHMVFGTDDEERVLRVAAAVVTTSRWCAQRLVDRYAVPAALITVAPPGVDPAPAAPGTPGGSRLLCVAAVAPHKGQDVLVEALASIPDAMWSCTFVGSLERDPRYVSDLRDRVGRAGIAGRAGFAGPRTGHDLDVSYAGADLLVLPSRGETYGMVVTEALARAIPVLATDVGGVPEALGRAPDGSVPGLLVPSGDPPALAAALRTWLADADLRHRLRRSAMRRRAALTGWPITVERIARGLAEMKIV